MPNREIHNNIYPKVGLNIQAITTDTTTDGNAIDLKGYDSAEVYVVTGTVTDGDYTLILEESATGSFGGEETAVADTDLVGTEALASFTADTDDNKIGRVGYVGSKRYIRPTIVSTSTSSGATLGVLVALGNPNVAKVGDSPSS